MLAIDLFSGAGGMTQGLKDAGFEVIGAVEIVPVAIETYLMNHPEVCVFAEDIRNINCNEAMRKLGIEYGELDLLAGCPPCQGFSSMRTKNGSYNIEDERNDLVFEFVRLIEGFLPKFVLMENVPGLAKDERITSVLVRLRELGYHITENTVQVLDAADYGVPQRRKRMILAASRVNEFELKHKKVDHRTVFDAIGSMPPAGCSGDPLHDMPENRVPHVLKIIEAVPKNGGSRSDTPYEMWLPCHKRNPKGFKDVYGRMAWHKVSPTITGGCTNPSKGRFLHPEENRAITLREAALIQTFPKDYYFSLRKGKGDASLMIGNALPPKFIKEHAMQILESLT